MCIFYQFIYSFLFVSFQLLHYVWYSMTMSKAVQARGEIKGGRREEIRENIIKG